MGAARKLQTFDEMYAVIAALPDGQHGEILGPGWAREMSRPGAPHATSAKRLIRRLGSVDGDEGGAWWIEAELEVVLPGERLYVPDLLGWRVGDGDLSFLGENPIRRVPDWACEILSRASHKGDRVVKLPVYAAAGVGHTWVIDPDGASIEVYAPRDGVPCLIAHARGDADVALPPFDLPINVAALLAPPGVRPPG